MRRIHLLLNNLIQKRSKFLIAFVVLFLTAIQSYAQPVARIRANGKPVNSGDTLTICTGSHIIFESASQNFTALSWRFNNGNPQGGISTYQDITFTTPGMDTAWHIASSSLGKDSMYVLVLVNDVKPTAGFGFVPDNQCANIPVTFSNSSAGNGLTYAWDFDDNFSATQQNPSHQFLNAIGVAGTQSYNVKLIVTNNQACKDSITKIVTVKKIPDASLGNADPAVAFNVFNDVGTFKYCQNLPSYQFQFINQTTTAGIITQYTIHWGDGSPDSVVASLPTNAPFTHTYGNGQHELIIYALGSNGCIGIKKYNIFLGTTPAGGFASLGNTSICSPNILRFVIGGFQNNPPGTNYTITVNDGTPAVSFTHPAPDTISHLFTAGSCGNSSSNGSQNYINAYRASLDIENPCGTTSVSVIPIYVSGKPKAIIGVDPYLCTNTPTTIVNASLYGGTIVPVGGGNSICSNVGKTVWSISPSTGFTITGTLGNLNGAPAIPLLWSVGSSSLGINFNTPGTYTIKLYIANDQCGMDTISKIICVRNPPQASFTMNKHSGCGVSTVVFNNTSPINPGCLGETYDWQISYSDPSLCGGTSNFSFVNGTTSTSAHPQISFTNPGMYIVTLNVFAKGTNGCVAVASDTFYVKAPPVVNIQTINAVCLGNSITPTATISNCYGDNTSLSYNWSFTSGSPGSSNQLTPGSINYTAIGNYPISLQVTNECGVTTATSSASITNAPAPNAGVDKNICSGNSIQLGSAPAGFVYQWSPIVGLDYPNNANPIATLTYSGSNPDTTYRFTITASAGANCVGTDEVLVTVKKNPTVSVTPTSTLVCSGTVVQLAANGASTYVWSPLNGLSSSTGNTVSAVPATSTTYTVVGTIAGGCSGSATATINVNPSPVVNAGADTVVCSFSPPLQLSAVPAGGTWAGSPFLSANGLFNPAAAGNGTFNITYTASIGSCTKIDTVVVTVIDAPVANAGRDTTFCQDSTLVQLIGAPSGGRWSGSPFVSSNGLFNISVVGSYPLIYTYGSGLCIGIDTVIITVNPGITNNIISSDQTVCTGITPSQLIGQNISGGIGTPLYQWQSSTNNFFWSTIAGAISKDYSPSPLTQTTWFRRVATTTICSGSQASYSAPVKITVNQNAKADFNPTATSGCAPFVITPAIVNLTQYNGIVSEYRWFVNGNYIGSGEVFPGYTINNNNESITIKLVAVSMFGCKNDSIEHTFISAGTPSVNAGSDSLFCQQNSLVQLSAFPQGGGWSGSSAVTSTGLFNISVPGVYTLIYTYGSGVCIGKDTVVMTVGSGIINNVINVNQTICSGTTPATLIGAVVSGGSGTPSYQWQSSTDNVNWIDITSGTGKDYSPGTLTQATWFRRVAKTQLCFGLQASTSAAIKITVNPDATAEFNPTVTSGCAPFVITPAIINLTPNSASVSEYRWYVDGTFIGSGLNFPGYTINNNNDSVTVKLIAISRFSCKNDTLEHGFKAAGSPTVNAGSDSTFCQQNSLVQLTAFPVGGGWSGSSAVTSTGLFNISLAGTYTLIYTYGTGVCIGKDTVLMTVTNGISNNTISANQTICTGTAPSALVGQNVSGGSGTVNYQWQLSLDDVNWTNVTGATSKDYPAGNLTQTTWYRRVATTTLCSGLQANFSTPIKITVNPDATAEFTPTVTSGCAPFIITPTIINLTQHNESVSEYRWYVDGNYIGSGLVFPGYTINTNNDSITVMLIAVNKFGCVNDSILHGFKASGSPTVHAGNDSTFCQVNTLVQLPASPVGGIWSGSPAVTSTGLLNITNIGTYTLVYTYGTGTCIGSDTVLITVTAGITNNIISNSQTICTGTAPVMITGQSISGGSGVTSYQWQSSTDNINWTNMPGATGLNVSPGVLTQSTWFRRIATNAVCSGQQANYSTPVKITINPNATAEFNPSITSGCTPFIITPSIINLKQYTSVTEYRWFVNGNYMGSGVSFPGYTMSTINDSITVKLVAVSSYGCKTDSTQHGFITAITPSPAFTQNDSIGCGPLTITFSNGTPNAPRYNYLWDFGNGQFSTLIQPLPANYAVAANGGDTIYTVKMHTITSCDTITKVKYVTVRGKPRVRFAPNKFEGCSPMTVGFTNTSSASNASYVWDFGDGTPRISSNNSVVQHTYIVGVKTTFNIKLIGTNDCGKDSIVNPIIVNPNTINIFYSVANNEQVGCAPHTVHFVNNTIGATKFTWDFGDGSTLTTSNTNDTVVHTYTSIGIYSATLKATGICNDTTSTIAIDVKTKPTINFSASPIIACIGDSIRFTNNNDPLTVNLWRFGDGTSLYARNAVKAFSAAGTYRVWLIANWNFAQTFGCSDSSYKDIFIRDTIPGAFSATDTVSSCIPFTATFKNLNGPSSQTLWNFGDNITGAGDSVTHTFNNPGSYLVKMNSRSISGCNFIDSKTIKVIAPAGTLLYNPGYACANENVRFEIRGSNSTQYQYVFGDGDTLTTTSSVVLHPYSTAGLYVPHAYLLNGSCRIRINTGDTIKVDKIKTGYSYSQVRNCDVTNVQFTDTSTSYFGLNGWQWDFGDGTFSNAKSPAKAYTRDGTYFVRLRVAGISGCVDTLRGPINISIRHAPVGNIGSDSVACTGQKTNFSALIQSQDSVVNISWNFGNNVSATGSNVSTVYNVAAAYVTRLITTSLYGCADTTFKTIRVNATPLVNAGVDVQICRGQNVQLAAFGADTYRWSPLQNLSCSTCASPVASPLFSTQYVAYGTTVFGCTSSDTVVVAVTQPFKITVSPNDTMCVGQSRQLFVNGATRYLWNPVTGLSSGTAPNPIATPAFTTRYMVIGNDAYTCFADTGYVTVAVGQYPTVDLGVGATLLVGTPVTMNPIITNGPIRYYTWTPVDDLSCTNCPRPVATINKDITYKLVAENIYGCKGTDTITYKIKCDEALQVYIPNAFSPDGDGLNDVFMVRGRGLAMVKFFRVFNRWGQMVFERYNFAANDVKSAWDGRVNGKPANPDVYVYTAEVLCAAGDTFTKKGNVTLVR